MPYKLNEQRKLENVQRRATKMIPLFRNMCYRERLAKLKIPTLAHRRRRGEMIDVFKYLRGVYDTKPSFILFGIEVVKRSKNETRQTVLLA